MLKWCLLGGSQLYRIFWLKISVFIGFSMYRLLLIKKWSEKILCEEKHKYYLWWSRRNLLFVLYWLRRSREETRDYKHIRGLQEGASKGGGVTRSCLLPSPLSLSFLTQLLSVECKGMHMMRTTRSLSLFPFSFPNLLWDPSRVMSGPL